jgi:hypothetical protein
MGDDGHPVARVAEEVGDLIGGELTDGDDVVGVGGRVARLGFEALAKVRRRIFGSHHEEVVEGGDGGDLSSFGQTLVEAVEEAARAGRRVEE